MRCASTPPPPLATTGAACIQFPHLMSEHTLPNDTVILNSSVCSTTTRDRSASFVTNEMMEPGAVACRWYGSRTGDEGAVSCMGRPMRQTCWLQSSQQPQEPNKPAASCTLAAHCSQQQQPISSSQGFSAPSTYLALVHIPPGVRCQPWVVDPVHQRVGGQPLCNAPRVGHLRGQVA